jgi:hypothetical protein
VKRVIQHAALLALALLPLAGPARAADPVIAAAGDIACDPSDPGFNGGAGTSVRCRQRATSDLLVGAGLAAVLPLGDIQYDSASLSAIQAVYHPTWGRVKSISRPVLGNHEGGWNGYFDYFNGPGAQNGPAGPRGRGYYSFDVGSWHLIALNSNCDRVRCFAGSAQERWLRADLAAHPAQCILAYSHYARYSSGHERSHPSLQPLWAALHDAKAEILLSAHSHNYERFTPLSRDGRRDRTNGIRQFVVGTGGAFFTGGLGSKVFGSEVSQDHTFGVLKLTLRPGSYDWRFVPVAGSTWTDSGSQACHGPAPAAPAPPPAVAPDRTAPVISALKLVPRRFRRRATFRFSLSEAANVRVTISRRSRGRARYRRLGGFEQAGQAGPNRRRFRGRLRGRRLGPGTFRAGLRAVDAAGNRSRVSRITFRIVRRRR